MKWRILEHACLRLANEESELKRVEKTIFAVGLLSFSQSQASTMEGSISGRRTGIAMMM